MTDARPLAGIRIVDLSTVISGPLCTALLADQGADVVKVEAIEGDTARSIGPGKGDLSALFIAANRGKRCIALDLKQPDALTVVHRLLACADVVVNNFRPGVMTRLGLADAALAERYPSLIRLDITGFGPDGPRADDKAYDAVIQAVSGFSASHRNPATSEPHLLSTLVCDKLTAFTAAQAVTAALFARSRDGKGRQVEVAMLDAAVHFQWPDAMYNHTFVDEPPARLPEMGATLKPWVCADGHVATMAPQPAEFRATCAMLGVPELADDPRFATSRERMRHGPELRALLEPHMARMPVAEVEATARRLGAPVGRVNEHAQVLSDPQVLHNRLLCEVDQGAGVGTVRQARAAARFDGQALPPAGAAPHLGEHGHAILQELGYDAEKIAAMAERGIWATARVPGGGAAS